ncbi:thioredoxin domain-containing protein [Salarchaeum sp. JOR-1]|uniref:thioredoxin domain-containing protein n=1 Tax=Salarchaeum sp. JOR-1 TaxID=2599399 RepID=UPI0011988308|nr:thioredoxin domain-containing protein [Salarchaeum sp. JOR-1]QDX41633.1 thioredoxin domain-containing protein [Salarchaeum sp. JOR-1]
MTDPLARNRLSEEGSPYLRQHADNPVHWQPWDDDAIEAARERDRPLFVSIGYSACHWCHVMEEESFSDPDIAATLNDEFVPVKVDREERPDLDDVFMTVCQLVRGGGGWPLSVWLTPELKPFYVGTYFPPDASRNQPGFRQLLDDIAESWRTERADVEARADQWTSAVRGELEDVPDPIDAAPGSDALTAVADAARDRADDEHGGWGGSQKFPQPSRIHALLRAADRTGDDAYTRTATRALDAMADGGLRDHVGGGFHRYCVDRDWTVPHFEKMLYDNAELARAYTAAHQATGDDRYAEIAGETLDFVDRELSDGRAFYATLDARSGDEEGSFYVWTPDEVDAAVADAGDAELFRARYGVTEPGNFEGDTVLTVAESVETLADDHDLRESEVAERLERAREQVFETREGRTRPARDEKVISAWNGLAVRAFAEAGLVLDDAYGERAAAALDFAREELWDAESGALARRWLDGERSGPGYLDDYAFLARGALTTYEATGDHRHLAFALDLSRALVEQFYDENAGALYFSTPDTPLARPQETEDRSTPSPVGVACETLLALDAFAPDDRLGEVVKRVLETQGANIRESPLGHASLALAADTYETGHLELTVAAAELPEDWRRVVADTYLPDRLLSRRPPTDGGLTEWLADLGVSDAPPLWAGREATEGATAYVCRRACSPPLTTGEELSEWIREFRP